MPVTEVAALGWDRCARLANAHAELLVTLDVGPRILTYQVPGGENILRQFPDALGKKGEPRFVSRGGHRMWVAPEGDRTFVPDNSPVRHEMRDPNGLIATTPATDPWQVERTMNISLANDSSAVTILHEATNRGKEPAEMASWGLTIMAPGGFEVIPQPPLGEHGKELLPNRVIVPWTYTDLSDDRYRIGTKYWLLTPKPNRPSTKLGFAHLPGWVAYSLGKQLFIKTFGYEPGATYPDLGCNYETFAKGDFIELETLSPLKSLQPGESVSHKETWHLFADAAAPDALDEASLGKWLQPFVSRIGIA